MGYPLEKLEEAALAKLAREPGTYSDGGGLRLRVRSPTSRSWEFSYTLNHTLRSIGLGSYPEVTLAMARARASEAQRLVKAQRDPHEAWAVARAAERAKSAKAMTFQQCAEKMHAHRTHWGQNYTAQWLKVLSTYAFPVIGNLPVATINSGLLLKVLEPIWTSRTETASRLRGRIENDEIITFPTSNIGVAVGMDDGLVVPVVIAAERLSLAQIAVEIRRIAANARAGKIEGMGNGVVTITNLGMFGVEEFSAIINPPESAILAVGATREEVIVTNGAMRPGKVMTLTLSADHRIVDGMLAAKFFARLKELLEQPTTIK